MRSTHHGWRLPSVLALLALALIFAVTASADAKHLDSQRLVVRGTDTVVDHPCPGGLCIELTGGSFRGTVGSGAYTGSLKLDLAGAFPNGEGGVCAPVAGHIVLGDGTPDRLDVAVWGDSCQDGAGDPAKSSFTGLTRFAVVHGTGAYARSHGHGIGTFVEDAADREQLTLIGRISR
jgi:hypothetical protein